MYKILDLPYVYSLGMPQQSVSNKYPQHNIM